MGKQNEKVFVSMLTDYGFKLAFGSENNTIFLREVIESIVKPPYKITSVEILSGMQIAQTLTGRSGAVDVFCKDEKGNSYIIEMQRYGFENFIQRLKFYAFHEFNKLTERGDFKFLTAQNTKIYTLSFLTGTIFNAKGFRHVANLRTTKGELVDDQTTHIFIELPKFTKDFSNLRTKMDKILYIMKYTDNLTIEELGKNGLQMPNEDFLQEMIRRLKMANLTPQERSDYARAAASVGWQIGYMEKQKAELKEAKALAKKNLEDKKSMELLRKESEAKRKESEAKRKESEAKQKESEAKQKESEAKRKAEEVKRKAEEVKRKAEEVKRKVEEVKRKAEEVKRKAEEAKRKAEEAKRKEAEIEGRKEEVKRKEAEMKLQNAIVNLLKTNTLTDVQIAQIMQVSVEEVVELKSQL